MLEHLLSLTLGSNLDHHPLVSNSPQATLHLCVRSVLSQVSGGRQVCPTQMLALKRAH